VALKDVTEDRFNADLKDSFRSGIATDLQVSDDQIVVTSVTATSGGSRRRLLVIPAAAAGDALAVAFKVTGEAEINTNGKLGTTSEIHLDLNRKFAPKRLAGRDVYGGTRFALGAVLLAARQLIVCTS